MQKAIFYHWPRIHVGTSTPISRLGVNDAMTQEERRRNAHKPHFHGDLGRNSQLSPCGEDSYEIRIRGHLDSHWSEWFDDLTIAYEDDRTVLAGPIADQSALHGLLIKIRDLGLPLLSLELIEAESV